MQESFFINQYELAIFSVNRSKSKQTLLMDHTKLNAILWDKEKKIHQNKKENQLLNIFTEEVTLEITSKTLPRNT